jgi:hypothetical protein
MHLLIRYAARSADVQNTVYHDDSTSDHADDNDHGADMDSGDSADGAIVVSTLCRGDNTKPPVSSLPARGRGCGRDGRAAPPHQRDAAPARLSSLSCGPHSCFRRCLVGGGGSGRAGGCAGGGGASAARMLRRTHGESKEGRRENGCRGERRRGLVRTHGESSARPHGPWPYVNRLTSDQLLNHCSTN